MKIFALIVVAASLVCRAVDIPLLWDAPADGVPQSYVLYASTNAITPTNFHSATIKVPLPPSTGATLKDIVPGTWWFTVSCVVSNGLESDCSNILAVQVPLPPVNTRLVAVQFSANLTNWIDAGSFRIQIKP